MTMQMKLDDKEIMRAIANHVAMKLGRNITATVSLSAKCKLVDGKQTSEEIFATVDIQEEH